MAEEKQGKKWEGPGEPDGQGGMSSPQPEEVEGRARQVVITCFNCGASGYIPRDWQWYTCWKCGVTIYSIGPFSQERSF